MISQLIVAIEKTQPDDIRVEASQCLIWIAEISEGRQMIIINDFIGKIAELFDDVLPAVRNNAYMSLLRVSRVHFGRESVCAAGIIEILVKKCEQEKDTPGVLV